jgi:hypothetical protein
MDNGMLLPTNNKIISGHSESFDCGWIILRSLIMLNSRDIVSEGR